jgi:hypothetical protein
MKSVFASAVLVLSLAAFATQATSAPIIYEFTGVGSGQMDRARTIGSAP